MPIDSKLTDILGTLTDTVGATIPRDRMILTIASALLITLPEGIEPPDVINIHPDRDRVQFAIRKERGREAATVKVSFSKDELMDPATVALRIVKSLMILTLDINEYRANKSRATPTQ